MLRLKKFLLLGICTAVLALAGCQRQDLLTGNDEAGAESIEKSTVNAEAVPEVSEKTEDTERENESVMEEEKGETKSMKIQIESNGNKIIFELNDSQAAKDLYGQLPLTTGNEDFSNNEKTFYPPAKLDVAGAPHTDGSVGTLAYYEPWGDVVVFYGGYNPNDALYELGRVSSGSEYMKEISGEMTISVVEEVAAEETKGQSADGKSDEKILIAYFTWADNTVVEDEEAAVQSALEHYEAMGDADRYGVDAVSSASVVQPGNTAMMADWIQKAVGGDLFSIQAADPYPSDYNDCMDRAYEEKSDNVRPELKTMVENFEQYDTIFIGFPNWWSSLPMPIYTFLESYDFSGKTIIPFCAHGTGGVAATVRELKAALPESAKMLDVLGVYRADILNAQTDVQEWLKKLGFTQ